MLKLNENNWNHIAINVNHLIKSLYVYTNFNLFNPDISYPKLHPAIDLQLKRLAFCNSGTCYPSELTYTQFVFWGAAFYKNIRIWDGASTNAWVMMDYLSLKYI